MNKLEAHMVALLDDLKENHHVLGIKAEFEAEGTRLEEAMRLKDVTSRADLDLTIKIGGCEAIKDMLDAISLGAKRIIAPMVETPYALQKFLRAAACVFGDYLEHIQLFVNIETITAYQNFAAMLAVPEIHLLHGVVIGRVDFVGSLGQDRAHVNSADMLAHSLAIAAQAKAHNLSVVVGGGVSMDSLDFFKAFPAGHLDGFETRKVIFQNPAALVNAEQAFRTAIEFELLWLKNKRHYYSAIAREDNDRIAMMESRYQKSLTPDEQASL